MSRQSSLVPAVALRWPLPPYLLLHCGLCSFSMWVRNREEIVSITRLKPCMDYMAKSCVPRCRGRSPSAMAVRPPSSGSRFEACWFRCLPSNTRSGRVYIWETFLSHPVGGFCMFWDDLSFTASTEAVPAMPANAASKHCQRD
jgi:hypothetical protein